MLKTDPEFLHELYRSAVRKRDRVLASLDRSIERMCGPAFMADEYDGEADNPEFETISQTVPRIIWDNPRVRCTTVRTGPPEKVAEAMTQGINRQILVTNAKATIERMSYDFLLRYGVLLCVHEPAPPGYSVPHGYKLKPMRPRFKRISVRRYFEDPTAIDEEDVRFQGHECIADLDDLQRRAEEHPEEGWNLEMLSSLAADVDLQKVYRPESEADAPKRGEVAYYEMYLVGHQLEGQPGPDEGFNGAVFTLAVNGADDNGNPQAEYLREPYMLYGPPGGCYTVVGEYGVPDERTPLSAIVAAMAVLEERSKHGNALKRAAARRKQVGVGDSNDGGAINEAKDGDWINVPNFETAKAMVIELGGVTETAMGYKAYLDQKADRMLGASDATVGNVTGVGTATENSIAAESASTRVGYIKRRFMDGVEKALRIMAWYLYHDERVVFPLPKDAQAFAPMIPGVEQSTAGPAMSLITEPWFMGGAPSTDSGYSFGDLEMYVEPYSMERTSEQTIQAQGQFLVAALPPIMDFLMAHPEINAMEYLKKVGDSWNMPNLAQLVNPQVLMQMQGMMAMQMMAPDPQMSGNVGMQGSARGTQLRAPGGGGRSPSGGGGGFGQPSKTGPQRIGMQSAGPAKRESPVKRVGAGAKK